MKTICDGCGKNTMNPATKAPSVGLYIDGRGDDPFMREQYGRFAGKVILLCWECWLLGMLPPDTSLGTDRPAAGLAGEGAVRCPECGGKGTVDEHEGGYSQPPYWVTVQCSACRGTGRVAGEKCPLCDGGKRTDPTGLTACPDCHGTGRLAGEEHS